jgi:putative ABC transport system substrate-binding protein
MPSGHGDQYDRAQGRTAFFGRHAPLTHAHADIPAVVDGMISASATSGEYASFQSSSVFAEQASGKFLMIKRREFITLLGGAAVAWPLAARAQQPALPVVGSLSAASAVEWADRMTGLRRGLTEMGFIEGRSVAIEYRWADNQLERLPALAADLVGRKIAVIMVGGNVAINAAKAATATIPIVFMTATDPVAEGLVASLNRPGGNLTGVTNLNTELGAKRLELLHEVIPTATKIALLVNPNNSVTSQGDVQVAQAAARRLGLEIIIVNGGSESEIEGAFATAVQQRAAALDVGADAFFSGRSEQLAALARHHALPTIFEYRLFVAAGGLMSYGPSLTDAYRRVGVYTGRILKGEKPVDLPVLQPTKFEFVINLKTAKALGLEVPLKLHAFADEVIE